MAIAAGHGAGGALPVSHHNPLVTTPGKRVWK